MRTGRSMIPLCGDRQRVGKDHVGGKRVAFPRRDGCPRGPRPSTRLLRGGVVMPGNSRCTVMLTSNAGMGVGTSSRVGFPIRFKSAQRIALRKRTVFRIARSRTHPFVVGARSRAVCMLKAAFGVSTCPSRRLSMALVRKGLGMGTPSNRCCLLPNRRCSSTRSGICGMSPRFCVS